MKDIKTFLIGFLTCCCMFLIMGQGNMGSTENGKYQAVAHTKGVNAGLFLVDTRNGEIYKLRELKKEWKEFSSGVKID